jgi:transcriptional regulator with XRE-family HTH domain
MQTKIDVRRAIIERGYKIPAFAEKCGMTPVNLRENIIKGNPTVKKLSEICEVLNCDITDLFYPIEDSDNTENNNHSLNEEKKEKENNTQEHPQLTVNTTAFCPHCGAKVRVGVVLLPEE